MSGKEYDEFVLNFRKTFLAPADPWDFMDAWRQSLIGFDFDVLQMSISETAADVRVLKTPARFYLPIILDYAGEFQDRKRRREEAKQRSSEDKPGVASIGFAESFRKKKAVR